MLRDATRVDWPALLALNAAWVEYLSPMDAARLAQLATTACYLRVAGMRGNVGGFAMAFRKGADYDGAVFRRFCAEAGDFIYIDRIVVDPLHRKQGVARQFYDDIVGFARAASIGRLTCEVNVEPPNEASLRFHRSYGFRETGRDAHNGKIVSLLRLDLPV
jgi:predicted GNAT superfamily acetyltransferase